MAQFEFIDYDYQNNSNRQSNQRRRVRSHVARHQWSHDAHKTRHTKPRSRLVVLQSYEMQNSGQGSTLSTGISCVYDPLSMSSQRFLSPGYHVDPFWSYPVEYQNFYSEIVAHYITHMAVNIPELDGPSATGLLRKKWFPLVMTEPATFLTLMLLAASHLDKVRGSTTPSGQIPWLRYYAITAINQGLDNPQKATSDALIGAVAKMCSYEAMYGTENAYMIHMQGLQQMIALRGGMCALGMNGLLRRLCLWIDLNSAALVKMPRMFDEPFVGHGGVLGQPNLGQFIGSGPSSFRLGPYASHDHQPQAAGGELRSR